MIFNIQRYSTHDGQGIRTIIFYKGCPLSCRWCCNPESQSFDYSLMFDPRLCKDFGECVATEVGGITPGDNGLIIDRSALLHPGKLTNVCPSRAITISGENRSVSYILEQVEKDRPFYKTSGGGVTLSGGEPLAQGDDMIQLLRELRKREIDVVIETSLHVPWSQIESCLGLASLFLVDMKHTDKDKFCDYTGGDLKIVTDNLGRLAAAGERIIIRVPVVPGFNHTYEEIKAIVDFVSSLPGVNEIHFLPYHTLGNQKYNMLGIEYLLEGLNRIENTELTGYVNYAESMGLSAKTGG